jgi:hypothetical protein
MKKSLFLAVTLMVILLSSCKKDESISDPTNLSGTSWVYRITQNGGNYVETIKFTSKSSCTIDGVLASATISISGTYTYEPPNINLDFPTDGGAVSGTIKGDAMTLSISGETYVYSKQ